MAVRSWARFNRIIYCGGPFGANVQTEPSRQTAPVDIPPDVFEALVVGWTEILVADYERRQMNNSPRAVNDDAEQRD